MERSAAVVPSTQFGDLMAAFAEAFRVLETSFGPVLDLLVRLWLAQAFFVSGLLKASNWDTALYLAANEYPVAWLDPATAAVLGVVVELLGSVLLVAGFASRLAAAAMLVLALVIQFNYRALDTQLLWAALLAWIMLRGAGALSLDHLLRRGSGDTAVPFAGTIVRTFDWISRHVFPGFQLLMRIWLAAAVLVAALSSPAATLAVADWLPVASAPRLPAAMAGLCTLLLATGFATRFTAIALAAASIVLTVMDPSLGPDWRWAMAFGLLVACGGGTLSLDALVFERLRRLYPQLDGKPAFALDGLPRVVIIGAGFGGLACARALRRARVQITLIDRNNYHLFQPLLYQVATASLAPGDIATPVRGLFRDQFNTRVLLGTVTAVDTSTRSVKVGDQDVAYDYLVLATGASHSYFGRDDWAAYAPGLKRVEDATDIRRRVLAAFERAEACDNDLQRSALLTFLIVGGGPTGVELAGAIAELARLGMEKDFRRFDPAAARVILVQAAPRILPTFTPALSDNARRALEKLGVEVHTGSRVEAIDANGVTVNGRRIASRTVLWAAGVVASPAARWLGREADSAGRLKVTDDLSVPGLPGVFAIGDTALSTAWNGQPVPGLAPAAKQGGQYVAAVIAARIAGRTPPPAFRYRHLGSLATIGRKAAVADFGRVRLSGASAWWLWGMVHIGFLVGVRNRVSVMFDWLWAYLTLRSGTRLITGLPVVAEAVPSAPAQRQFITASL